MASIGLAVATLREALHANGVSVDGLQIALPEREAELMARALRGEFPSIPDMVEMPTDRGGRPSAYAEFMGVQIVKRRD